MTNVAEFEKLLQNKRDIEKQITEDAKGIFADAAKAIFEKYGDKVASFGWTQYTPFFNDGDPCVFSAGDVMIVTPEDAADEDFDRYDYEGSQAFSNYGGKGHYPLSKQVYRDKSDGRILCRLWTHQNADEYELIDNPDFDPELGNPYTEIHALRALLDDDTLLDLFGDHVEIIVTAEGVEVEEYEHE